MYMKETSVVPGNVISLFYKICKMICTFLPALHKLKYPATVEIWSALHNQLHTASWTAFSFS
jgi:hypothetical protein